MYGNSTGLYGRCRNPGSGCGNRRAMRPSVPLATGRVTHGKRPVERSRPAARRGQADYAARLHRVDAGGRRRDPAVGLRPARHHPASRSDRGIPSLGRLRRRRRLRHQQRQHPGGHGRRARPARRRPGRCARLRLSHGRDVRSRGGGRRIRRARRRLPVPRRQRRQDLPGARQSPGVRRRGEGERVLRRRLPAVRAAGLQRLHAAGGSNHPLGRRVARRRHADGVRVRRRRRDLRHAPRPRQLRRDVLGRTAPGRRSLLPRRQRRPLGEEHLGRRPRTHPLVRHATPGHAPRLHGGRRPRTAWRAWGPGSTP